jgi:hypothetical protein
MKLGLGFLFGAKDAGARKSLKSTVSAFGDIDSGARSATRASDRLRMAISSITASSLNEINDKLSALGSGEVRQLTSDLQAQSIQFNKSFTASAARAGIFGSEMKDLEKQVFGVAYALNADADAVGEAAVALRKMGLSEKDLGLKNMSELAKFASTAGIDIGDLAKSVSDLKKSYSFGEGTGDFVDRLMKQSTAMGLGTTGLASLTQMMGDMDSAFAKTLAVEGPAEVEKTTSAILKLAGAMKTAVGTDPQVAMEQSIALFKTMAEQADVLPGMMAGLSKEFDPLMESLAIDLPGGFAGAFDLMKSDPAQFMATMEKAMTKFRSMGEAGEGPAKRLLEVLSGLGPDIAFLADSGGAFGKAVEEGARRAGTGMSEFSNQAYKSGLTLDDMISRAREGFKTRLFGLTQKETKAFVKGQQKMYSKLGDAFDIAINGAGKFSKKQQEEFSFIEKAATKLNEAGLGPVVKQLLYMQRVGPLALGPMFDILQEMAPLMMGLGAMGVNLSSIGGVISKILGPLKWVGGFLSAILSPVIAFIGPELLLLAAAIGVVVGAVYLFSKALEGSLGPVMKDWAVWMEGSIVDGLDFGAEWLAGMTMSLWRINPEKLVDDSILWLESVVKGVTIAIQTGKLDWGSSSAIEVAGSRFMLWLGEAILAGSSLLSGIFDRLSERIEASGLSGRLEAVFKNQFSSINWDSVIGDMASKGASFRAGLSKFVSSSYDYLSKSIGQVNWLKAGEAISKSIAESIGGGGGILSSYLEMEAKQLLSAEFWSDALAMALSSAKLTGSVVSAITKFVAGFVSTLSYSLFKFMVSTVIGVMAKSIELQLAPIKWALELVGELMRDGLSSEKFASIVAGFSVVLETMWTVFKFQIDLIAWSFSTLWSAIEAGADYLFGNSIHTLVETDLGQIQAFLLTVATWFEGLWVSVTTLFWGMGTAITSVFDTVYTAVTTVLSSLKEVFYNTWETIKQTLSGVSSILGPAITKLIGSNSFEIKGDMAQASNVKSAQAATDAKLLEQADNRALMVMMQHEFEETRVVLKLIAEKINPATLPVVAAPAGAGKSPGTQTGTVRTGG